MATIDLGKIKLVWRGTYAGGTAYTVDDVVSHTDSGIVSSYICTTNSTGNAPSTGGSVHGSWAYLAKGAAAYTSTLTTQGDILYRDGSGEARLGYGTAGQVLQTGGSGANPSWGTVSSDYVKLATAEYSSAVTNIDIDNIFSSTYRGYKILVQDIRPSGNNMGELQMRFLDSSGSEISGSYYIMNAGGQYHSAGSSAAQVSGFDNNRSSARLGNWNLANAGEPRPNLFELTMGQMHLNKEHSFIYTAKVFDANGNYDASLIGGVRYSQATATRGVRFQVNGGHNFSAYIITVWGLK